MRALIKPKIAGPPEEASALLAKIDTEPATLGRSPSVQPKPRVFAIMGHGGNGITYAQLASKIIASEPEKQMRVPISSHDDSSREAAAAEHSPMLCR
ncbi:hypothetical protein ELH72_30125 (plasmid) [Rhizobium ruizarguesonis]|jgi:hypothetical protein|uniref:hypothetical protein n=1 Tax=Rhizobium ruizarguesonis TaxID=2081791 RepID=UPI001031118E|nr:hypothetical protein [Rhizobium ruizarguesonis]TAZ70698.1 hypothetical protein ELH72_30125 [Rhizobium ruizarguesonis]